MFVYSVKLNRSWYRKVFCELFKLKRFILRGRDVVPGECFPSWMVKRMLLLLLNGLRVRSDWINHGDNFLTSSEWLLNLHRFLDMRVNAFYTWNARVCAERGITFDAYVVDALPLRSHFRILGLATIAVETFLQVPPLQAARHLKRHSVVGGGLWKKPRLQSVFVADSYNRVLIVAVQQLGKISS